VVLPFSSSLPSTRGIVYSSVFFVGVAILFASSPSVLSSFKVVTTEIVRLGGPLAVVESCRGGNLLEVLFMTQRIRV